MKKVLLTLMVVLFCAVSAQGAVSLLHRYSFTTDTTDSVGTATGTLNGSAVVTGGKLDCFTFGGSMSTPGIKSSVEDINDLTVEVWVADVPPVLIAQSNLFSWGDNGSTNDFCFYATHTAFGGNSLYVLNTPGGNAVNGEGTKVEGTQHWVYVLDKTNDVRRVYLDGVEESSVSLNGWGVDDMDHTSATYVLGDRHGPDGTKEMHGKIDEYRIWDGAMTAGQAAAAYALGPDDAAVPDFPTVDAGVSQGIKWPTDNVVLDGTVDFGDITWSKVSGPGTVVFTPSANVEDPTATFSASGTYVLELEADDAGNASSDTTSVVIVPSDYAPMDYTLWTVESSGRSWTNGDRDAIKGQGLTYVDTYAATHSTTSNQDAWIHFTGGDPNVNTTWYKIDLHALAHIDYLRLWNMNQTWLGQDFSVFGLNDFTIQVSDDDDTYVTIGGTRVGTQAPLDDTYDFSEMFDVDTSTAYPSGVRYVLIDVDSTFDSRAAAISEIVLSGTELNQYPVVEAGYVSAVVAGDNFTHMPSEYSLNATTSDDGIPSALTLTWSQIDGPIGGTATFSSTSIEDPTVEFDVDGVYELQLEAYDGQLTVSDTIKLVARDADLITNVEVLLSSSDPNVNSNYLLVNLFDTHTSRDNDGTGAGMVEDAQDYTADWWMWTTNPADEWVVIDLGNEFDLYRIEVWNFGGDPCSYEGCDVKSMDILASNDPNFGGTPETLIGITILPEGEEVAGVPYGEKYTVTPTGGPYRYIKLDINSNWGAADRVGLAQVEFYGTTTDDCFKAKAHYGYQTMEFDWDDSCVIDLPDFAVFAAEWLVENPLMP